VSALGCYQSKGRKYGNIEVRRSLKHSSTVVAVARRDARLRKAVQGYTRQGSARLAHPAKVALPQLEELRAASSFILISSFGSWKDKL